MIDSKPSICVMFVCSERDDPGWLTFGVTSSVLLEAEVRYPIFIGNKLTIVPRGERFVAQDDTEFREMFDQMFKLLGIMSIPWCDGELMDHTSVDIHTDVEFETVFAFSLSFDSDVVPSAAVMDAESSGVHCDVHLFPSKKPDDSIHHLPDVSDGESFHPSLDHTMPRRI